MTDPAQKTTDLVASLRVTDYVEPPGVGDLMLAAADEIERLRAEIAGERRRVFEEAARLCDELSWPPTSNPLEVAIIKGGQTTAKNIAAMLRERANGQ